MESGIKYDEDMRYAIMSGQGSTQRDICIQSPFLQIDVPSLNVFQFFQADLRFTLNSAPRVICQFAAN